jgi:hypothetical protein
MQIVLPFLRLLMAQVLVVEWCLGAILGTGVGGGIVIEGRILTGLNLHSPVTD